MLDRIVEACLGSSLALGGLAVAAVLLPEGSGVESAAESFFVKQRPIVRRTPKKL